MIDLHTHSLFSDGLLLPSNLVREAEERGYIALAITDHVDLSNYELVIPRIVKVAEDLNLRWKIKVIPGVELTHVPLETIPYLAQEARRLGAKLVVVHGETIAEPVIPGTNKAALESDIDILAHPGLITIEEAAQARERSIFLEISTRQGHSLTNGHVVQVAKEAKAKLVINTDSHSPDDLRTLAQAKKIALGAGLSEEDFTQALENSQFLVEKCLLR